LTYHYDNGRTADADKPFKEVPRNTVAWCRGFEVAGFGSIRQFNAAFRAIYGRSPSSFRGSAN
jgi:hypothetical protein